MQTLLSNQKSDIGSPYVYYTLTVNPSNRTATQVDLEFTLEATLRSGSYIASGDLTGYFEFPNNQTRNFTVYDGGSWSGSTKSVTADWTINAEASATTIPTKFRIERYGGSAGTLYELEFNVDIPIGHEVPSNITYTITETNPLLVNAGVSNNLIVENLSIKQFAISYTLHGGATMTRVGVYNRTDAYSSTSSPFSVDLRQVTFRKNDTNTKIPLRAYVKDSFNTQGLANEDLYDFITYTPISLVESSTTAKRDGQISGKVNLNINGAYFNGTIGNVSQTSYKPTIKYKFWRTDATEPSTYSYTIPSSSITTSNGTFSVNDYPIGSTVESATNYFNPDYAYRVKIQVDDNFSTYYSVEKAIPVGEATWTEYPDHVDFKAITMGGSPIVESTSNSNGGYVKYGDGTIIQWKNLTDTIGGSSWGSVGYSDHTMGDWLVPFTAIYNAWSNINVLQFWTTCEFWNITSAGQIRAFRPNTGTSSATVTVTGIGKWK